MCSWITLKKVPPKDGEIDLNLTLSKHTSEDILLEDFSAIFLAGDSLTLNE